MANWRSKLVRSSCFRVCCGSSWWDALETFRRLVWVLAVGACAYFMVAQVWECVEKLKNPPIATQTQVVVDDRMDYPSVTFCFKNKQKQGYDLNMIKVRSKI